MRIVHVEHRFSVNIKVHSADAIATQVMFIGILRMICGHQMAIFIDEERIMCEMAVGAYRAGAQIYLTYYAKELAKCMDEGRIG